MRPSFTSCRIVPKVLGCTDTRDVGSSSSDEDSFESSGEEVTDPDFLRKYELYKDAKKRFRDDKEDDIRKSFHPQPSRNDQWCPEVKIHYPGLKDFSKEELESTGYQNLADVKTRQTQKFTPNQFQLLDCLPTNMAMVFDHYNSDARYGSFIDYPSCGFVQPGPFDESDPLPGCGSCADCIRWNTLIADPIYQRSRARRLRKTKEPIIQQEVTRPTRSFDEEELQFLMSQFFSLREVDVFSIETPQHKIEEAFSFSLVTIDYSRLSLIKYVRLDSEPIIRLSTENAFILYKDDCFFLPSHANLPNCLQSYLAYRVEFGRSTRDFIVKYGNSHFLCSLDGILVKRLASKNSLLSSSDCHKLFGHLVLFKQMGLTSGKYYDAAPLSSVLAYYDKWLLQNCGGCLWLHSMRPQVRPGTCNPVITVCKHTASAVLGVSSSGKRTLTSENVEYRYLACVLCLVLAALVQKLCLWLDLFLLNWMSVIFLKND